MLLRGSRRHVALCLGLVLFLLFVLYSSRPTSASGKATTSAPNPGVKFNGSTSINKAISELPEYTPNPRFTCSNRFGLTYLKDLRSALAEYCTPDSSARLTCFHSSTADDGRLDTMCIGGPVTYSSESSTSKRIRLDCALAKQPKHTPEFSDFPLYWYSTGPRFVFNTFVKVQRLVTKRGSSDGSTQPTIVARAPTNKPRFSVLVKREEGVSHPWHTLMQIFSFYLTMDVLRVANDPNTNAPFFSTPDIPNTQVIILDDFPDGPFYPLWQLFADLPILRWDKVTAKDIAGSQIIVPLGGASNPMWQSDWKLNDCTDAPLLRAFVRRVLEFHKLDAADSSSADAPEPRRKLKLTYVSRKIKRRLREYESHLDAFRKAYPDVDVAVVDFAAMSLGEQLRTVRETDVLAGVHGAALTHGMFMRRKGSALVELLPPGLDFFGFRNMARMSGVRYFGARTAWAEEGKDDWHDADLTIAEEKFVELLGTAVKSLRGEIYIGAETE